MRAAIYARVSKSNGQQSPEMQLRELREYVSRRDWQLAAEYTDTVCAATEHRPQLDALTAAARRRQFDAVIVYRYDRFARSLRHLVNALEEFRALGIDFVSLQEGVDTSTPNGRLVFGIFASIAEFERELIRGRVRSGLAAAKARGKRLGRPRKVLDTSRIPPRAFLASRSNEAWSFGVLDSSGSPHRLRSQRQGTYGKPKIYPTSYRAIS